MRKLCFELSMPNCASWNGRWSGEGNYYAVVKSFTKKNEEMANRILKEGYYYHRWDDGWGAGISVKEVDSQEAAKIKRKSKGFRGYDWMIENIISHNSCYNAKKLLTNQ